MMSGRDYAIRVAYFVFAALSVVAILYQVFLVGLSLLGGQPSWDTHIGFGHAIGILPLLMLILAFVGRLPGTDKRLVGLFFGVYIFQAEIFAVVRDAVPMYAALHPVLALVVFTTSTLVAWRAYALVRAPARAGREVTNSALGPQLLANDAGPNPGDADQSGEGRSEAA